MIVPRVSAQEIRKRLAAKRSAKKPIWIASAGSGLVAKILEKEGVDCINTFSGARLRSNGMGTMSMMWPILDSNEQTLRYTAEDILPAMSGDAFVCPCLNANDPLKDMGYVLEELQRRGVQSVSNIGPSISYVDKDSQIYAVMNKSGITFENEVQFLKHAKALGMVTIGLAFDEEDSCRLVEEAKPDIFCFHAGTTKGGMTGFDSGETIEETSARTEAANAKLRALHSDVILVAHGAAMESPEDTQYLMGHTSCDGFWTGSSTERLPIERAVSATAKEFAAVRLRK